jgi:hypothetical protein
MFPFPFGFIGSGEVIPDLELISNDYAMYFDKPSAQYVSTGESLLSGLSNFSLSAWFKFESISTINPIISNWVSGTTNTILRYNNGAAAYQFYVSTTDTVAALTTYSTTPQIGTWYHVAAVYSGSNISLYLNGSQVGTPTSLTGSVLTDTNPVFIGKRDSEYFDGDMDEVAIWNKALELADIQTIYNSTNNNPGKCANLFTGGLGSGLVFWNRMGD